MVTTGETLHNNVWVVVPAYNEAGSIVAVLRQLCSKGYDVVVVDDASKDATLAAAQQENVVVVPHPVNLGQGAALQTGIDYALGQGAEFIVSFDADGQHVVSDIAVLLNALKTNKADIALGSRFLGQAINMSLSRRWLLHASRWLSRTTTGVVLTDTQNGLRAMTAETARTLRIRQNRFAHALEIIGQIKAHRLRYVEVPTTVIYTAYSRSKGQTTWSSLTIMADLILGKLRQW